MKPVCAAKTELEWKLWLQRGKRDVGAGLQIVKSRLHQAGFGYTAVWLGAQMCFVIWPQRVPEFVIFSHKVDGKKDGVPNRFVFSR